MRRVFCVTILALTAVGFLLSEDKDDKKPAKAQAKRTQQTSPGTVNGQNLPNTGQQITPTAPTDARFEPLNPGLSDFPSYTAGQAVTTAVNPRTTVEAKEDLARHILLGQGATVEELVHALTAIGSTPRDVIAILQNLRAAGALEAELEVI